MHLSRQDWRDIREWMKRMQPVVRAQAASSSSERAQGEPVDEIEEFAEWVECMEEEGSFGLSKKEWYEWWEDELIKELLFPGEDGTLLPRWDECYWCDLWQQGMNVIEIGEPLCDWCQHWYAHGGRPYSPNACDRLAARLGAEKILPKSFPFDLLRTVADFLVEDWKP